MTFKKAERSQVKLKLGITGPSGSGKTLGALAIAKQLAPSGRIAVLDTENGSAALYSDRFDFDTLELAPPYESKRFMDAIDEAVSGGYDVFVIDSLSHQWAGDGGILARKEQADKRGGNSFTNWAPFTKEHEGFKAALLNAPIHIVACMRTKQDYVLEQNGGKSTPKKVGTAPIQREGMEYEFSVVFDVQMDHRAKVSKDRTDLFGEKLIDLTDGSVGKALTAWQAAAKPVALATDNQRESLDEFAHMPELPQAYRTRIIELLKRNLTYEKAESTIAAATKKLTEAA